MTTKHDSFRTMFPVTKDLHSMRKKGIMQEDIFDELRDDFNIEHFASANESSDIGYISESIWMSKDKSIGVYVFSCSMGGIPTYEVGVMSNNQWKDVRQGLRDKNLVR